MNELQVNSDASRKQDDGWRITTFAFAIIAVAVSILALANSGSPSASPSGGGDTIAKSAETVVFEIEIGDMFVKPSSIDVAAGANVILNVTNVGKLSHDLTVVGTEGTGMMVAGAKKSVTVGPFDKSTEAWCTISGHKESGMLMAINVIGASAVDNTTVAPSEVDAVIDPAMMPAADNHGRDAVLPAAVAATVHEIALDATEVVMEVAPGVTQEMWTFNNQVPGPMIRGKIGDTFRFTLTNRGKLAHSIDFHASKVAWSDEMRSIQPGESLVYEYKAEFAGAFMYHCGTAPALHHIGNGMYGAIIIDPPGLAPVDKEFAITQSELYLGPDGKPGDLAKMLANKWDAVVFNGYFNQYKFFPIAVEKNMRYRIWVINDGPNENSAFHIVGTIFDTVYKEGNYTLKPGPSKGGSQVLDLQPAQGGFVEFTFAEDGLYPFVTHKFSNVGKGALGFFAVGDVDTSALTGH